MTMYTNIVLTSFHSSDTNIAEDSISGFVIMDPFEIGKVFSRKSPVSLSYGSDRVNIFSPRLALLIMRV